MDDLYRDYFTLNGSISDDCYGHASLPPGNSPGAVESFVNTNNVFGTGNLDDNWKDVYRIDSGGGAGDSYFGLNFSITGLTFGVADSSFMLVITDSNGALPLNLPLQLDLIFTLKSATETDFFLFEDEILTAGNDGSYYVSITNRNVNSRQNLSDITVLVRDPRIPECKPGDPVCTPNEVPEPGVLSLFGLALLAAGARRWRRA